MQLILLLALFINSCCDKAIQKTQKTNIQQSEINNQKSYEFTKNKKITFIFDFDDTIYDAGRENKNSYIRILHKKALERQAKQNPGKYNNLEAQINDFIKKNLYLAKTQQGTSDLIKMVKARFKFKFTQDDVIETVSELNSLKAEKIDTLIIDLIKAGYDVQIIGGGTYGCAIIPEFTKNWHVKRENIYSGYGRFLQESELANIWTEEWRYANCENLQEKTPYSENKSDIIKYIKNKHKNGNKFIMIGDGETDLEAFEKKSVDYFIGYGVTKIDKKVIEKAQYTAQTTKELSDIIESILQKE
jgi:phosphoglycolate phosphatase-like HAD superfamily hydrolase